MLVEDERKAFCTIASIGVIGSNKFFRSDKVLNHIIGVVFNDMPIYAFQLSDSYRITL